MAREGFLEVPEVLLTADDWTESFSRPLTLYTTSTSASRRGELFYTSFGKML